MKNLKKLGKVLGKQEQKSVNGGKRKCHIELIQCTTNFDCGGCTCLYDNLNHLGYCI